jgi:hypothetical protein
MEIRCFPNTSLGALPLHQPNREFDVSLYNKIVMTLREVAVTQCTDKAMPALVAGNIHFVGSEYTSNSLFAGFEVLTAVVMKSTVLWDITP